MEITRAQAIEILVAEYAAENYRRRRIIETLRLLKVGCVAQLSNGASLQQLNEQAYEISGTNKQVAMWVSPQFDDFVSSRYLDLDEGLCSSKPRIQRDRRCEEKFRRRIQAHEARRQARKNKILLMMRAAGREATIRYHDMIW